MYGLCCRLLYLISCIQERLCGQLMLQPIKGDMADFESWPTPLMHVMQDWDDDTRQRDFPYFDVSDRRWRLHMASLT